MSAPEMTMEALIKERDYWKGMHAEAYARLKESDNDDAHSVIAGLRDLLDTHQELSRLQGNRLDALTAELGQTQAKLRAAQGEIARLTTALNAARLGGPATP